MSGFLNEGMRARMLLESSPIAENSNAVCRREKYCYGWLWRKAAMLAVRIISRGWVKSRLAADVVVRLRMTRSGLPHG
jgi:hypothetical protein